MTNEPILTDSALISALFDGLATSVLVGELTVGASDWCAFYEVERHVIDIHFTVPGVSGRRGIVVGLPQSTRPQPWMLADLRPFSATQWAHLFRSWLEEQVRAGRASWGSTVDVAGVRYLKVASGSLR